MAYTKFTGKGILVTFNSIVLEGIDSVEITSDASPLPEMMDTTTATASAYEMTEDPLGGKGTPKSSVRVTMLDSKVSYGDSKIIKQVMGVSATLLVQPDGVTSGSIKYSLTARLQERKTTLGVPDWTKLAVTFEANDDGVWASN
jgi:hypothetical protein